MDIVKLRRAGALKKEWEGVLKRERSFLDRRKDKKDSALNRMLADKVPEKLQRTLDAAFEKAFYLIFEKGTDIIEKTYKKEELEKQHMVNRYAEKTYADRRSLRAFSKSASRAGNVNLLISGVSGVGLGLLGIGLADIPLFVGMLLRAVYETALNYGYDYSGEEERYFLLLLIEGAVSYGDSLLQIDGEIERFIQSPGIPERASVKAQISRTSGKLSKELLYMKFLQGTPIVGALGGVYDAIYIKQVSEYARIKYQKRFLKKLKNEK